MLCFCSFLFFFLVKSFFSCFFFVCVLPVSYVPNAARLWIVHFSLALRLSLPFIYVQKCLISDGQQFPPISAKRTNTSHHRTNTHTHTTITTSDVERTGDHVCWNNTFLILLLPTCAPYAMSCVGLYLANKIMFLS